MKTHVVPLGDLREHELTADCWCSPQEECDGLLIVHNAADEREKYETGERKKH